MNTKLERTCVFAFAAMLAAAPLAAQFDCAGLPSHADLTATLKASIGPTGGPTNGGFDFHAWAVLVNRDSEVCAVTMSGTNRGDQFPISRLAAVFKATTANINSLPGFAISTPFVRSVILPGTGGETLELANPVNPDAVYPFPAGVTSTGARLHGTTRDPLVGKVVGGFSSVAGGLPLYDSGGKLVGGLGIGGDTACGDHNIAWRVRQALNLHHVPFGLNPQNGDDGIVYDVGEDGVSATGLGHPFCFGLEAQVAVEIGAGSILEAP